MNKILLAAFSAEEHTRVPFVESLARLMHRMGNSWLDYKHYTRMPIHVARRRAADEALEGGYTHLAMVDDDQIFPPDALEQLLKHKVDVVSALAYQRKPPYAPCMFIWCVRDLVFATEPSGKPGLQQVDATGFPFVLIKTSVLKALTPDWFGYWKPKHDGKPGEDCGEDIYFCFTPGTWVYGQQVRKIEDIEARNKVTTHKSRFARVVEPVKRHYSGSMYRIKHDYGTDLNATPEHPILVRRSGKQKWIEAQNVRPGDWLYLPKPLSRLREQKKWALTHYISPRSLVRDGDGNYMYARTRKSALHVPASFDVTPGFCRLLGYFIAEGSVGGRNGRVQNVVFTFGHRESELVADCVKLLGQVFPGCKPFVSERPQLGTAVVICTSRIAARLFVAWCGRGAHNKKLPRQWYRLNDECLKQLVRGVWLGDGYCDDKRGKFSIATTSEQLAHELRFALLRLGIVGNAEQGRTPQGKPRFNVRVASEHSKRFSAVVDYVVKEPSDRSYLRETKKHFLVKVRHVEVFDYSGPVYNMEVEKVHTYTANGVAVHNCARCRDHNIPVHVDTSLVVGHLGAPEIVTGETYRAYKEREIAKALAQDVSRQQALDAPKKPE